MLSKMLSIFITFGASHEKHDLPKICCQVIKSSKLLWIISSIQQHSIPIGQCFLSFSILLPAEKNLMNVIIPLLKYN